MARGVACGPPPHPPPDQSLVDDLLPIQRNFRFSFVFFLQGFGRAVATNEITANEDGIDATSVSVCVCVSLSFDNEIDFH